MTQLTKNFGLEEFLISQAADRHNLDNTPTPVIVNNLKLLATNILQPLREKIAKPIVINSGYRSPAVNAAVGGSKTSAHRYGHAVDIIVPGYAGGNVKKLCQYIEKFLKDNNIRFDQLIYEFGSPSNPNKGWVHIGIKNGSGHQRGQVLTINKNGTSTGIV